MDKVVKWIIHIKRNAGEYPAVLKGDLSGGKGWGAVNASNNLSQKVSTHT